MGAAALDETLYLAGGYDGEAELATVYAFMPATGIWAAKAPLPEKRGGLGLVATGWMLYAIGGGWTGAPAGSERYDPAVDTWASFEAPFEFQWRNIGLAVTDWAIIVAGGWNGPAARYLSAVTVYPLQEGAY